jgi:hypothetical protein
VDFLLLYTHTHSEYITFHHQHLESTYLHNNKQHTHKRHFISKICLKIPRHCVHTNHAWFIARTKIFNCTLAVKILCKCMRNYSNTIRKCTNLYIYTYLPTKSQATISKNGNKRRQQRMKGKRKLREINREKRKEEAKKAIFNREQIYVCLICLHSLLPMLLLSFLYCCWRVNSHDNK